jgi:hypothetical protein
MMYNMQKCSLIVLLFQTGDVIIRIGDLEAGLLTHKQGEAEAAHGLVVNLGRPSPPSCKHLPLPTPPSPPPPFNKAKISKKISYFYLLSPAIGTFLHKI